MNRTQSIIRTSIIGIIVNVLLSGFKAFVGVMSNSVAITMDAVNNLSDAMSSLITMIGARLSAKEPDRKHPFGYGRIEYLSTMVIGVIIFYAGGLALVESIKKIISPETPDYSVPSLIIVTAAIITKIVLGLFTKNAGNKYDSDSLVASGKDALNDALVSGATLFAAIVYIIFGLSIEAYVGIIIALMILKTGFETLQGTINEILGARISSELTKSVKRSINEFPEVEGVYDVVIHSYGKENLNGSVHIEVPESLTASYLDGLQRHIVEKVYRETKVTITGISLYSINSRDEEAVKAKQAVRDIVLQYKEVLGMHGFYKDNVDKYISFDMVVDFDTQNKAALRDEVIGKVKKLYPDYEIRIALDYDISD